jgi:hypothetical protein
MIYIFLLLSIVLQGSEMGQRRKQQSPPFSVGQRVLARWTDKRFYGAVIIEEHGGW